jgi:hypothetical protein
MQVLKQSTAATILVGPVLDADGAAYTAAVIGDFNITKNGSTAAMASAATATHDHNGMYLIALTTGNTDTVGRLDISVNKATYGMTNHRYEVLAASQFDALITNGSVTPAAIADAVWDEPYSQHTIAGTFGKLMDILRKANLTIEGIVSNAITPTTLTFSSNVSATTSAYAHAVLLFVSGPLEGENSPIISYNSTNGVFVLEEPLTAAPSNGDEFVVIAGSHVHAIADIQSGLATSSGVTAGFTEIKGAGWSSSTDTLEEIRDAVDSVSGSTVTVAPLSSLTPERVNGTTISVAVGDVSPVSIDVYDANGVAIDLTAQGNLEVCVESRDNVDLQVVAHASITISGTGNRKATWTPNTAAVGTVDKHRWSLRTASAKRVLAYGPWVVERVALSDV